MKGAWLYGGRRGVVTLVDTPCWSRERNQGWQAQQILVLELVHHRDIPRHLQLVSVTLRDDIYHGSTKKLTHISELSENSAGKHYHCVWETREQKPGTQFTQRQQQMGGRPGQARALRATIHPHTRLSKSKVRFSLQRDEHKAYFLETMLIYHFIHSSSGHVRNSYLIPHWARTRTLSPNAQTMAGLDKMTLANYTWGKGKVKTSQNSQDFKSWTRPWNI